MSDVRLTATNPEDSSVVPVACNSRGELLTVPPVIEQIDNDVTINGALSVNSGNQFRVPSNGDRAFEFHFDLSGGGVEPNYIGGDFKYLISGDHYQDIFGVCVSPGSQGFNTTGTVSSFYGHYSESNFVSAAKPIAAFQAHVNIGANLGAGPAYAFYATSTAPSLFGGEVIVASRNKRWTLVEQGGLCHMVEEAGSYISEDEIPVVEKDYPKLRDVFNELNLIEGVLEEIMSRLKMVPPAGWEVWDGSNETA